MPIDAQSSGSRLPTLVQYCQRGQSLCFLLMDSARLSHGSTLQWPQLMSSVSLTDSTASRRLHLTWYSVAISNIGDGLRFELLRPVLFGCTPETLLRLETASPVRLKLSCSRPAH